MALFVFLHVIVAYLFWITVGAVLFVLFFQVGAFSGQDILFFRGIWCAGSAALLAIVFAFSVGRLHRQIKEIVCPQFSWRDGLALFVAVFSSCLTFLIVFPVTIDRSVTVFLLAEMEKHGESTVQLGELEEQLRRVYIEDYQAVDRRMTEQIRVGNVEPRDGGFALTPKGRAFLAFSRVVADLFHTSRALIEPQSSAGRIKTGRTASQ